MEGVLPMMGILILAFAMGIQSIPIAEAFADLLEDSTGDLERTVDTRAYSDFYYYNYIPLAAKYALNDASYELGKDLNAGLNWNENTISKDYSTLMQQVLKQLEARAERRTGSNLNKVIDGSAGASCKVKDEIYNVTVHSKSRRNLESLKQYRGNRTEVEVGSELEITEYTSAPNPVYSPILDSLLPFYSVPETIQVPAGYKSDPMNTTCRYESSKTNYFENTSQYITYTDLVDNKYVQLADETIRFHKNLSNELEKVDRQASGYDSCCGLNGPCSAGLVKRNAEDQAVSTLEYRIEQAKQTALNGLPIRETFEIIKKRYKPNGAFEVVSGRKLSGDSNIQVSSGICCESCGEGCTVCAPRYSASAQSEAGETEFNWELKETELEVIVNETYEKLSIQIDPYIHNWDGNSVSSIVDTVDEDPSDYGIDGETEFDHEEGEEPPVDVERPEDDETTSTDIE